MPADGSLGVDVFAQQIADRDVRQVVVVGQQLAQRAFTCAGGAWGRQSLVRGGKRKREGLPMTKMKRRLRPSLSFIVLLRDVFGVCHGSLGMVGYGVEVIIKREGMYLISTKALCLPSGGTGF